MEDQTKEIGRDMEIFIQCYAATMLFATLYAAAMTLRIRYWGPRSQLGFVMAIFGATIFDCLFCIGFLANPKYCAAVLNATLKFGEDFHREYAKSLLSVSIWK